MECMLADDYFGYAADFGCGYVGEGSGGGSGGPRHRSPQTSENPESDCFPTTVPYAL